MYLTNASSKRLARRSRSAAHAVALLLAGLVVGFVAGTLLQRSYGVGTLLRTAGVLPRNIQAVKPISADVIVGIPHEFHGKLSLFVLAGQSNMSGVGDLPASQTVHPRIFLFGNDYRWKPALEPIDSPQGQVDKVSEDPWAGSGPGFSFALSVAKERPDMVIGLIPCAKSDTTIGEWQRSLSDSTLYGSCLKRIRAASLEGKVAGLLFFQGEADAYDPTVFPERPLSPTQYARKFSAVVHDLRTDLSSLGLPVIFAQIGTQQAPRVFSQWEIIREQQGAVQVPCSGMITTDDLPLRDGLHFTTASYRVIGERFAATYIKVASQCIPPEG